MMMGALLKDAAYYVLWYAKQLSTLKYRQLYLEKRSGVGAGSMYSTVESPDGTVVRKMTDDEIAGVLALPAGWHAFRLMTLTTGGYRPNTTVPFKYNGREFHPGAEKCWRTTVEGLERLAARGRIVATKSTLNYKAYLDDFPAIELTTIWNDTGTGGSEEKVYVVQTPLKVIQRCMLMSTDPGDIVLDPTCGGATTAILAEQWGRRWITCDTSRVALALSKQRLLTASFEYYQLAKPEEGVDSGFLYKSIPHITLKSVANDEPPMQEVLYDEPLTDLSKVRVTGPFTVEAVPAPMIADMSSEQRDADATISRSGATLRESDWRNELQKTGVRSLGGKLIKFARVEPLAATTFLHAEAETVEEEPQRVVISFGPQYAPLEQRQVEGAWKEAQMMNPAPSMLLFAAFQFDPEAAKDIDEVNPRLAKMTFLKVQMNMDLLTGDLKKKRASNEGFWLIGRPDVELKAVTAGEHKGKHMVEVHGFDYYDVKTGNIESGNANRIAMWMLDTDYDERSLFPRQVFFPMAGDKEGWSKVAKSLKAEIDEELIEAYRGTVSLPFHLGKNKRVAVKIIDDRGVESMRVVKAS